MQENRNFQVSTSKSRRVVIACHRDSEEQVQVRVENLQPTNAQRAFNRATKSEYQIRSNHREEQRRRSLTAAK